MNYEAAIESGVQDLEVVRQFQEVFPAAEHFIVESRHQSDSDGWQLVWEWVSRASLFDRYVMWLGVAIDAAPSGRVFAIDEPNVCIVELKEVEKGRDDDGGPKWRCGFAQLDDEAWQEIVEAGGDFTDSGIPDSPVDRFDTFWRDTRPSPLAPAPDGLAMKAAIRFMS